MMRLIAGLRMALIALALVGVAACSSKDKPDVAGSQANAVPGSERDFITNVGDRIQFIVDQSTLTPEAQNILRRQATWLRQYGQVKVQVEGHSDERGTREYNMALGERRANSVRDYMVANGIATYRIETVSYGEERSVAYGSGESNWSQNRRVELK